MDLSPELDNGLVERRIEIIKRCSDGAMIAHYKPIRTIVLFSAFCFTYTCPSEYLLFAHVLTTNGEQQQRSCDNVVLFGLH
jgi:hypothetical protein